MSSINKFSISPRVIAHRGASAYAPENTLAAFLKAKELGATWLEFDVTLSSDGQVVIIHDDELDRTTNGKGNVNNYSYADLEKLDAGSWFHPDFFGEKIPTLKHVIPFLHRHHLAANVEIKSLPGQEKLIVDKVLNLIQQQWQRDMFPPLLSSFSLPILYLVRQQSPLSLLGLLMHSWMPNWEVICNELQCVSVNLNEKILDQEKVKQIKATDRLVLAYTVNDPQRAKELFSWGVDAVFSDYPDRILSLLLL